MARGSCTRRIAWLKALIAAVTLVGCSTGREVTGETAVPTGPTTTPTIAVATTTAAVPVTMATATTAGTQKPAGFDDHTVPSLASLAHFDALATTDDTGRASVKFVITEPLTANGAVHFYDGAFYTLHDQWYWFRLLNGQSIIGAPDEPVMGRSFETVEEAAAWAAQQGPADLPLGLGFSGDRLYSRRFYDAALPPVDADKKFGIGTIVKFPDRAGGTRWLLEFEHVERITPESLTRFFDRLSPTLPADIARDLVWVVRSPAQEAAAKAMEEQGSTLAGRVVRYPDLVEAGAVEVYSSGVAVGRLRFVGEGEGAAELAAIRPDEILITEHPPDWLPPARAVITSDPQTPLAHINLLARNRNIPSASSAGVHLNAAVRRAADVRSWAVVVAEGSTLRIALLSPEQVQEARTQLQPPVSSLQRTPTSSLPLFVDLADLAKRLAEGGLRDSELETWRPKIGGKSVGFALLLSTPGVATPPDALAITIRPYLEHVASFRTELAAVATDDVVRNDPRARWLVLEGSEGYEERFALQSDATFAADYAAAHPVGQPIGDVLAAGGVRRMVMDKRVDPKTLGALTAELARRFGEDAPGVGLRFRSSSNVEDIEGFNGAGLYTSTTGFLDVSTLDDEGDRKRTIENALVTAWSSYWSSEAFGERTLAGIDHLSGAMALTVHARFDDDSERNNGVATFAFLRGGAADDAVLDINVQDGSASVTNPDPKVRDRPEQIRVVRRSGSISIERLGASSLVPGVVLSDVAIQALFDRTASVADVWRRAVNADLDEARRLEATVLDFEFKTVLDGWPRRKLDPQLPGRLVIRQVRSLDRGLRHLPKEVRALRVPRDVLMRAVKVVSYRCASATVTEVRTDPLAVPDVGFSTQPWRSAGATAAPTDCPPVDLYVAPTQRFREMAEDPKSLQLLD